MKLYVHTQVGETFIHIKDDSTIHDIKHLFKSMFDIPVEHIRIIFLWTEVQDNNTKLRSIGIGNNSEILLIVKHGYIDRLKIQPIEKEIDINKKVQLFIKLETGNYKTLNHIMLSFNVFELKNIISRECDIPISYIKSLVFNGKTLDDAKQLVECGIRNESTIHLKLRLRCD